MVLPNHKNVLEQFLYIKKKHLLQNPPGEITGLILLNLILRQEYGNVFFTLEISMYFSMPRLKVELNESSPKWANCLQTDGNISAQLCTKG